MNISNIPQIISIEGNIGSGKSTLVAKLSEELKEHEDICFLQEPVELWNSIKDERGITIIEKFYAETEKHAFEFQLMAYISRLSILKNAVKCGRYKYIITERCVHTDANVFERMLYDDKKITQTQHIIYRRWFDEFISDFPITKVIYVKTDPETAFHRVIQRNRLGEHIPLEYLKRCSKYHDNWIHLFDVKKLIINANVDMGHYPHIMNDWTNMIKEFIFKNN
jgi:deoxyadenosine/deoxycytidine kinase